MKNLLVCLLVIFIILPTTVFAHYNEINYECVEELPCEAAMWNNGSADMVIDSSGDEILCYCPESIPETSPECGMELMSDDSLDNLLMECWDNLDESISVVHLGITKDEIGKRVREVLYANPIYYYVSSNFQYSYKNPSGVVATIYPKYMHTDKELIQKNLKEIEEATEEILFYIDPGMSEIEKIMTVHDYMIFHYDYDKESEVPNRNLLIMLDKKGVCVAYALAFTHLMNQLDIETRYVSSEKMNHAWNLVKVNREWYHIDLTWDDPVNMPHYWTSHKYALLSDSKIQSLEKPHYGYELGDLSANSWIYDDANWHEGMSAIVTLDDISYWIEGNSIVCENGDVIYEGLDGGDSKWSIGERYVINNEIFSGLAGYNSKLYFNTDKAIYSYNPLNKELKIVKDIVGVCGMYIDRNTIYYDMYNRDTGEFEDAGSIHLEETSYSHPYIKDNKLIVKVYRDTDERLRVFSSGANKCNVATVASSGITSMEFDVDSEACLYFWDENFKPLREKIKINK